MEVQAKSFDCPLVPYISGAGAVNKWSIWWKICMALTWASSIIYGAIMVEEEGNRNHAFVVCENLKWRGNCILLAAVISLYMRYTLSNYGK